MNQNIRIGIIGGSGLYEMEELIDVEYVSMETPFGSPSDAYIIGDIGRYPGCLSSQARQGSSPKTLRS